MKWIPHDKRMTKKTSNVPSKKERGKGRWAFTLNLRFNETYFEWLPFGQFSRGSFGIGGHIGWLWFCFNWSIYRNVLD